MSAHFFAGSTTVDPYDYGVSTTVDPYDYGESATVDPFLRDLCCPYAIFLQQVRPL